MRASTRVLTALIATIGTVAGVCSPARAGLMYYGADNFNFAGSYVAWEFSTPGGPYSGGVKQTADPVHKGVGYLRESAAGGTGWGSLGRSATMAPATPSGTKCSIQASLRTETPGRTSTVNVEVIDPATWRYIALNRVTVGTEWAEVQTPDWVNGPTTVYFRVSLFGDASTKVLLIDDVYWKCFNN
ncbi:hypothetical protein COUCH_05345 [Couchioplanes caeruleus]|uniref:hypothetical protein n=1 Tax=Couchioplanes caeruleus TaxID=56438 RepID=UPI0020BDEDFD|nr:hypothetical protein [Couchioplanes caeruleus]UQU65744.1 hypothetical protein COUCH_05345 [Couchioplanes caeruleus]